jgi:hypothetical protein
MSKSINILTSIVVESWNRLHVTTNEIGKKALFVGRPSFNHARNLSLAKDKKKHADQIAKFK